MSRSALRPLHCLQLSGLGRSMAEEDTCSNVRGSYRTMPSQPVHIRCYLDHILHCPTQRVFKSYSPVVAKREFVQFLVIQRDFACMASGGMKGAVAEKHDCTGLGMGLIGGLEPLAETSASPSSMPTMQSTSAQLDQGLFLSSRVAEQGRL